MPNTVQFNKIQSNAGTVKPSPTQLAIIAPASGGTANQPGAFSRPTDVQATYLEGPGVEFSGYFMDEAELPVVYTKSNTSTPSSCGSITTTKTGTFTPTVAVAGGYGVADDYDVLFKFPVGGTLGTPGIVYQVSLDGGLLWGAPTQLGSALTVSPTIPVTGAASGMVITLGTGGQTVVGPVNGVGGDSFTFTTVGPRMTSADLIAALAALLTSKQTWDLLLVHGELSATTLAAVDTWLASLEGQGQFKCGLMNARFKHPGAGIESESEPAYASAMTALVGGLSPTIRVCVGADGAAMVSPISGLTKPMPVSLYIAARAEQYSTGVDPAEVDLGPIPNANIDTAQALPLYHDERLFPNLDPLGLSTFQSYADREGAYITDALLMSANGSDYFYLMNARTMNAACAALYSTLVTLLGQGIRVDLTTGFIFEPQRAKWNGICQAAVNKAIAGQVSGTLVTISATDSLSGNGPQTITATLTNVALKYVKNFRVTSQFANSLPATTAPAPS
jgi:hypothetical protein